MDLMEAGKVGSKSHGAAAELLERLQASKHKK